MLERWPEISASSPDGAIWATTTDGTDLRITFGYGVYGRYTETDLAHQLGRLGQAMWIALHRSRAELHERRLASFRVVVSPDRPAEPAAGQAAYTEALNGVAATGRSPDGAITVRTTGGLRWTVDIADGTLARLGEGAFVSQAASAVTAMLGDREQQIAALKAEFLDLGVPRRWTEALNQLRSQNRARN
ncbi:hypothetical protein Vlu01_14290 [Micromonospora lutea]|uniref:YbaB/EbfC DNA-binding family protein n=1 Tax=Micromonospora lutea TaxID=419825 RepID=A0ABQ4IS91_9ACTN|nr:hypothetical protein Vlu01_14290 [Micromonospora lutea]